MARGRRIPVEPQNLPENKNQDHAHVDPRLLHVRTNTLRQPLERCNFRQRRNLYRITNNTNRIPSGHACEANRQSGCEMHKAPVQDTPSACVMSCYLPRLPNVRVQTLVGGRANRSRNKDGDDEAINRDNTGHDDGDERLQQSALLFTTPSRANVLRSPCLHDQIRPKSSHTGNADA